MGEVLAPVQGKATPIHVKHHLHDHVVYAITAMHRTYRAEIEKHKNTELLMRDFVSHECNWQRRIRRDTGIRAGRIHRVWSKQK